MAFNESDGVIDPELASVPIISCRLRLRKIHFREVEEPLIISSVPYPECFRGNCLNLASRGFGLHKRGSFRSGLRSEKGNTIYQILNITIRLSTILESFLAR